MVSGHESPEITPEELIRTVEAGAPIRVLDVRAPEALAGGRIDIVPADRFINIRGSEILARGDAIGQTLKPDGPIAVVCGRGNSSKQIASHLNEIGFQATSLQGGMAAWADALVVRELRAPSGFDHLIQFDRIAKGSLAYLVGAGGEAIIIDPPRKARFILDTARELGLKVVGVADTHAHADYISGGPSLAKALRFPYYLHPADAILPYDGSPAKIEYSPLAEGQELPLGGAKVRVEHTPGHTLGSVTYHAGGAALTGDFVFIGSIGRPDLGGKADEWTPILWDSLERARASWPQDVVVFPAHYASDSERESDRSVGRALNAVAATNVPYRIANRDEFIGWVLQKIGKSPDSYRKIKAVNLGLLQVWDMEAQELDSGKNECALG
ncbi:MAG: MBL fold metallo-hydrolase [Candidatus Eiseniibacteriota bacterium]